MQIYQECYITPVEQQQMQCHERVGGRYSP